jgi:peptidoglycan hydrolase-like protein with peptidoglycan-binding domain
VAEVGEGKDAPRPRAAWAGRRRVLFAAVALVLVAVGVASAALLGGSGGDAAAESPDATGALATGTVARRTLAERLTAAGTIGYAGESTVLARRAGTITALPAVGAVIRRGEPLYAVSGEPVALMFGTVPAYRALAEGVAKGRDVEQLERNLAKLGYHPGEVDEHFTYATAAAVRAWQRGHGMKATGEVALGRVAFLPGPQRVSAPVATLGEALGGAASTPVLRTTSTRRVVAVELPAGRQSIARRGEKVRVVLPGGGEVPGEVRRLAAVEASGPGGEAGEEAEAAIEATVAPLGRQAIPGLDGAAADVLFTERVRKDVLSVPLTALIAIGGDRFAVYAEEGTARRRLIVTPGLAADGFVEVAGKGLRPGMKVEVGDE